MHKYTKRLLLHSKVLIQKTIHFLKLQSVVFYLKMFFLKIFYNYSRWIKKFDILSEEKLNKLAGQIQGFKIKPKISLVMLVNGSNLKFLDQAIFSIRKQIYPQWELCIVLTLSGDTNIKNLLNQYIQADQRIIKFVFCDQNCILSEALNIASNSVTGDFVGFLKYDSMLSQHALFWIVHTINKFQSADIIYSDEDQIDKSGQHRSKPNFKPDFNYEMFLSFNFISHFCVYRCSLIEKLDIFRTDYVDAYEYDLALRAIELIDHKNIIHIPKILYHSRVYKKNTGKNFKNEIDSRSASIQAVAAHLSRAHIEADVVADPKFPYINYISFKLPNVLPLISIIIPTRDKSNLLDCCLNSIVEKTTYQNYEIIIIDNGSCENSTFEVFEKFKSQLKNKLRILSDPQPYNYSKLNNHATKYANGEYLLFLNNDIEVITNNWLEEMLSHVIRKNIGCVGARLWYPNKRLQHGGVILGVDFVCAHAHIGLKQNSTGYCNRAIVLQSMSAVTAACLLLKKDIFYMVGGFDETLAIDLNDIDLCLKVRAAGYRNIWTPYAELIHYESASRGHSSKTAISAQRYEKERNIFFERWKQELFCDSAYNLNLSLKSSIHVFTYAWPPRIPPQYEDSSVW